MNFVSGTKTPGRSNDPHDNFSPEVRVSNRMNTRVKFLFSWLKLKHLNYGIFFLSVIGFITSVEASSCSKILFEFAKSHSFKRFQISAEVLSDLETFQLVVPTMTKKVPLSPWGMEALKEWLKNPLMDVGEIKKRQEAIRYLADIFTKYQNELSQLRSNLVSAADIRRDAHIFRLFGGFVPFGIFYGILGAGAQTGDIRSSLSGAIFLYMILGPHGVKNLYSVRQEFSVTKESLGVSKFWHDVLNDSAAPSWIQEWREKLGSTLDQDYSKLSTQLKNFLSLRSKNRIEKVIGAALDVSFFSSLTLAEPLVTSSKLTDSLGNFYKALGEFEVLLWYAEFLKSDPNLHFPEFVSSDHAFLEIADGHDPYIYYANPNSRPSSISLSTKNTKLLFGTGPNGRGKSVALSMPPSLLQWGMTGAPVPVKHMRTTPLRLFTSLDIHGDKSIGRSHFQAQANRSGQIYKWLEGGKEPAIVVVDEFYRGTTFLEHRSAERATLEDLRDYPNVIVIAASHTRDLSQVVSTWPQAKNIHVSDSDEPQRIYRVEEGPSERVNAIEEMKVGGVPDRVLDRMQHLMENTKISIENPK